MILVTDIDGTLANDRWRRYMLPDWNAYHRMSIDDEPNMAVVNFINALKRDLITVVSLTGRPEKWRQLTNTWLLGHNIMLDELIMRPDDNFMSSPDFKLGALLARFDPHQTVVLEDRDDVVTKLRGEGYNVFQFQS